MSRWTDKEMRETLDASAEKSRQIKALTARVEELEGLASSYLAAAAQVGGCGDGGCAVLRPTGMHTNGGCRCTYNMDRARERGVSRLLKMAQHMARAVITQENTNAES